MRLLMGCVVAAVLCAAAGLAADDKKGDAVDAKKLLGKWEGKDQKPPFVVEFFEGGKAVFDTDSKKQPKADATYKLDGSKLEVVLKFGEIEHKMSFTVTKLTDTELVTKDEKGKEETLTRVKGK